MNSEAIAIIGGAGYIGSHVTKVFRDVGYQVHILDNSSSGNLNNRLSKTHFHHCDILVPSSLEAFFEQHKVAGVVHLAAKKSVGESMENPLKYTEHNIIGTHNVLQAMYKHRVRHIVFSSSAAVYGTPDYLPVDEAHPLRPESYYGYTKECIEHMLHWYGRLLDVSSVSLRYFNAVGYDPAGEITGIESNPSNLLPRIMECATGKRDSIDIFGTDFDTPDGTGVRDYIHVSDLADAHLKAMTYLVAEHKTISLNLGTEHGNSVQEMIDASRAVTKMDIPTQRMDRRPGDPAKLIASSQQAKQILGWTPRITRLHDMIETTWKVYKRVQNQIHDE